MTMRIRISFVLVAIVAAGIAAAQQAQIANPLPAPVVKRGLSVEIKDVVRLPQTRGLRPADQDVNPAGWARISYLRDSPDGRRFVNDSRGFLYLLDRENKPSVYANVGAIFPLTVYNRLESGFIGFDFHPEFARNGLFYTVHAERAAGNPATPNFIPPGFTPADVTYHNASPNGTRPTLRPRRSRDRGASSCASRTSSPTSRIRTATSSSTRPRNRAVPTTGSCIRAAAISGSATAADRARTIRGRRSASTL
jgi:hypothetical protein